MYIWPFNGDESWLSLGLVTALMGGNETLMVAHGGRFGWAVWMVSLSLWPLLLLCVFSATASIVLVVHKRTITSPIKRRGLSPSCFFIGLAQLSIRLRGLMLAWATRVCHS